MFGGFKQPPCPTPLAPKKSIEEEMRERREAIIARRLESQRAAEEEEG